MRKMNWNNKWTHAQAEKELACGLWFCASMKEHFPIAGKAGNCFRNFGNCRVINLLFPLSFAMFLYINLKFDFAFDI